MKIATILKFTFCVLILAFPARATLLTQAYETQLEAWLGQGNLNFNSIFTKTTASTSYSFHAAVNGKGPTFVLISISGSGGYAVPPVITQVIGGYNPQSWNSTSFYNMTPNIIDRTAFIYNLTYPNIQRQNPDNTGTYQTVNFSQFGPVWGSYDIMAGSVNLSEGRASSNSYGGNSGTEIVVGNPNYDYGNTGHNNGFAFTVDQLEVYTFVKSESSPVPDSTRTNALIILSLAGIIALRRKLTK
jgi:hypothetical protein